MGWVVPGDIPAQDGSSNNGLEGAIGSTNSSDQVINSYQDQKNCQDPYPTTEATLPTPRLRQPNAIITYQERLRRKVTK